MDFVSWIKSNSGYQTKVVLIQSFLLNSSVLCRQQLSFTSKDFICNGLWWNISQSTSCKHYLSLSLSNSPVPPGRKMYKFQYNLLRVKGSVITWFGWNTVFLVYIQPWATFLNQLVLLVAGWHAYMQLARQKRIMSLQRSLEKGLNKTIRWSLTMRCWFFRYGYCSVECCISCFLSSILTNISHWVSFAESGIWSYCLCTLPCTWWFSQWRWGLILILVFVVKKFSSPSYTSIIVLVYIILDFSFCP
mgnify:CR=1 FL=1